MCLCVCYPVVDKLLEYVGTLIIPTKFDYELLVLSYICHLEGQKGLCTSLNINRIKKRMVKTKSVELQYFA
jgi:hypothetical protein